MDDKMLSSIAKFMFQWKGMRRKVGYSYNNALHSNCNSQLGAQQNATFYETKSDYKEPKAKILILLHPNFPFDVIIIKRYIAVLTVMSAKKKTVSKTAM